MSSVYLSPSSSPLCAFLYSATIECELVKSPLSNSASVKSTAALIDWSSV